MTVLYLFGAAGGCANRLSCRFVIFNLDYHQNLDDFRPLFVYFQKFRGRKQRSAAVVSTSFELEIS